MEGLHADKYGTSSSRGGTYTVVPDQQPPTKASSSTPRASQHESATASTSASYLPPGHFTTWYGSIQIPGFDKRSYGHPSQPPSGLPTQPHHNGSASGSKHARQSPSKDDPQPKNICNKSAGQLSGADPSPAPVHPKHHPSNSGDWALAHATSTRANEEQPATYDTLKQEGESPEDVIKRLQGAGLREVNVRMRRNAKGETVNTGLTTLDFLRKPVYPDTAANFITPAELALPRVGIVHEDPGITKGVQTNTPDKANNAKKSGEQLFMHGNQMSSPSDLEMPQAEADDRSRFPVGDRSGPHMDSATTGGINNSSDGIDSAQTNTNVTSQPSLAKTLSPAPAALAGRGNWVHRRESKESSFHLDSDAEGTEISNDDSIMPMAWANDGENGKTVKRQESSRDKCDLVGWDGRMQPPPVDWEHRNRYHCNDPNFISGLEGWLGENTVRTMHNVLRYSPSTQRQDSSIEFEFGALPIEEVQDITKHPDGIGFVSRDTLLTVENAEYYGCVGVGEIPWLNGVTLPDFVAATKVDHDDFETMKYRDETAQTFIDRRMMYLMRKHEEVQARRLLAENSKIETPAPPEPEGPKPLKTNIYLRPAVRTDYAGMTRIYNWHIEHGVRPSELLEITEDDMEARHNMSTSARLPFIVAVERNRKNSRRKPPIRRVNPNHPIQNTDPTYNAVVKDENIVGWAAATDWSASDYIETTTAELEIYVDPEFRQKGVGRCLMDALLDATDRGHANKGGYDFHAAPEIRHLYNSGGGRDLAKVIFQVRSFNRPITPEQKHKLHLATEASKDWGYAKGSFYGRANGLYEKRKAAKPREEKKDFSKAARIDDREDDYSIWLKEWLESFGFEEEAFIKKIGTKDKRLVDVRYLTKETAWQPVDNQIPDYKRGI
ncbi:hypothetical protein PV08_02964 [Exophiala spinifera]|uniref:N-acetyltransferase domain-containing protein n=1 Tax=Exophiala spinifera TaxID=91928 RepID=A0A0D2BJA9_9EURO|nr:uncharacterized protein PV08_02964 [Exophiala spinifera]KIW18675.1 hypothetical protein PV08_02964 [Exophiala spinifera]